MTAMAEWCQGLSQVEAGRLSAGEATAWLGSSEGLGSSGAMLAELFAMRPPSRPRPTRPRASTCDPAPGP
jgi:hypothetical protein